MKKFYITTPIYYINDRPHIGHAYTTIAADVLARWKRMQGVPVHFLTGTDEHGSKIAEAAAKAGVTPMEFTDKIVEEWKSVWKLLNISNDDFIRTTEPRHEKVVQAIFEKLSKTGDIYKGFYEGWYCVGCETFWLLSQLVENKCPDCKREVQKLKEESYFFKLSNYEDKLLRYFEENRSFLSPAFRAPEMVQFVKGGLKDLSVSRIKETWGIPVPFDPKHTTYVWFDALINYASAVGYASDDARFAEYWPADVQFVGKEIFRFHTVIWPAMLMGAGLEVPRNGVESVVSEDLMGANLDPKGKK